MYTLIPIVYRVAQHKELLIQLRDVFHLVGRDFDLMTEQSGRE